MKITDKQCEFPGCTTHLWANNVSGVCKEHLHSEACHCLVCVPVDADPGPQIHPNFTGPTPNPQRPGQRLASEAASEPSIADLCRPVSAKIMPRSAKFSISGHEIEEGRILSAARRRA